MFKLQSTLQTFPTALVKHQSATKKAWALAVESNPAVLATTPF
jgi:hypothetical protein